MHVMSSCVRRQRIGTITRLEAVHTCGACCVVSQLLVADKMADRRTHRAGQGKISAYVKVQVHVGQLQLQDQKCCT